MKRRTIDWAVLESSEMSTTHINNCILHLVRRLNDGLVNTDNIARYGYIIQEFNKELVSRGEPKLNVEKVNWVYCAEFEWKNDDFVFLDLDQEPTS